MNVSILVRGPMRPTTSDVIRRIRALRGLIVADGHNVGSVLLATWTPQDPNRLGEVIGSGLITDVLSLGEIQDQVIFGLVGVQKFQNGRPTANAFRQYYLSKAGVDLLCGSGTCDYIVHTRTDMDIVMDDSKGTWYSGQYSTIHVHSFVNDQYAVAPKEVMRRAWDYGSVDELAEYFRRATIPEDVLQMMLDRAGIIPVVRGVAVWSLDPGR